MTPADHQLLAGLVQAGRVTREQASWLAGEVARRGVPLATLLAEKGITGPALLSATVAAPPPRASPTPPAGVPLGTTVASPSPGGEGAGPGPLRAVDAEQLPPEVRAALADPRRRIGRWVSLAELGRGANGVVHRAFDPVMGRAVAIKQMLGEVRPEDLERFRREVVAGGQLRHPGIVGVHEVGVHQGAPFLVMELVEGQSFERLLNDGSQGAPRALEVVRQVALALAHAHGLGIIHRDVKPANILVDAQGAPRLGDFGLARLGNQQGLTKTGQVLGTPTTMAPEQAAGEQDKHGPATDVYALGAILYRIVTGRPPFQATTFQAQMAQILFEKPKRPSSLAPDVDPRLEALILRCLEKEPSARPGAADVAAELSRVQTSPPPRAVPAGVLVGLALVLVLASSLLGVLAARRLLTSGVAPATATSTPPAPPTEATPPAEPVRPRPAWRSARGLLLVADVRGDPRWCNGTQIGRLAATKDGKELVVVGVGTFRRVDATTGESIDLAVPLERSSDEPDGYDGRNEDWADAAAITDDGGLAARGDRAGRILLHRRGEATWKALPPLPGAIGSLLFDGGQLLAGAGKDLWRVDVKTGQARSLALVNNVVTGIARLGDTVQCTCLDGSLVSVGGGEEPRILPVVANVLGADFERAGGVELTGLASDGARLFLSLQRFGEPFLVGTPQQLTRQRPGLRGDALNVEVVAPGRLLLVGYPDGNRLVELSSGKAVALPGHVDQAHGAARIAAGACSGGYDGLLFAWSLEGERRGAPAARFGRATSLSVSPSGASVLTTGSRSATTRLLVRTNEERQLETAARSLAFDDVRVALWTDRLVLVDPTGALAPVKGDPPAPPGECVALLPGRKGGVLTCDAAGVIRSWSPLATLEGTLTTGFATACAAVSADRSTMVLGGADGQLLLVPLERPKEGRLIATHPGVLAVAFDGPTRVLSAGLDRRLLAWGIDGERDQPPLLQGLGHERAIEDVAPLGDGRLVTCARDGTVRLWSPAGKELDRLDLRPADVPSRVAVAPSGRRLYVGTGRGQLLTVDVP